MTSSGFYSLCVVCISPQSWTRIRPANIISVLGRTIAILPTQNSCLYLQRIAAKKEFAFKHHNLIVMGGKCVTLIQMHKTLVFGIF